MGAEEAVKILMEFVRREAGVQRWVVFVDELSALEERGGHSRLGTPFKQWCTGGDVQGCWGLGVSDCNNDEGHLSPDSGLGLDLFICREPWHFLECKNDEFTKKQLTPGCSELPAFFPENLGQGHHPCPRRQLCTLAPLRTKLKTTASICHGHFQGEDPLVHCPLAPAVLGESLESICAEVRLPCMTAVCVTLRLPGWGSSQRALTISPHTCLVFFFLPLEAEQGLPREASDARADELSFCPCVTLSSPGCSAGTLGWGIWQLIGACKALRSIKDDTREECSC